MSGREIVVASSNQGKLRELNALLAGLSLTVRGQAEFALASAEESGQTFVENAILKARHAAAATGLPALADDSGLCVTALGGAPGVHSARYAGVNASDSDNVQKLLRDLVGSAAGGRQCRFVCAMVYLRHAADPLPLISIGEWRGEVLAEARGAGGFGYDPVFFDPILQCSAAELDSATKNRVSHRGRAVAQLVAALIDDGATL